MSKGNSKTCHTMSFAIIPIALWNKADNGVCISKESLKRPLFLLKNAKRPETQMSSTMKLPFYRIKLIIVYFLKKTKKATPRFFHIVFFLPS